MPSIYIINLSISELLVSYLFMQRMLEKNAIMPPSSLENLW